MSNQPLGWHNSDMELTTYWRILKRRWPFFFLPAILILAAGILTYQPPAPYYQAGLTFLVSQPPAPVTTNDEEARYYNWLTSEYLVIAISDWINGSAFAAQVSEILAESGVEIPGGVVDSSVTGEAIRSRLSVSIAHGDEQTVSSITNAVYQVLTSQSGQAIPQLGGDTADLRLLQAPVVFPVNPGFISQMSVLFRLGLALVTGVAFMLVVEYLDPRIHSKEDLEPLALPILGEIPKS